MEIKSIMAGVVLQINTSVGATVAEGETLLVLESMKMEIPITIQQGGTVKEVKVNVGDFVNEGDVLAVLG